MPDLFDDMDQPDWQDEPDAGDYPNDVVPPFDLFTDAPFGTTDGDHHERFRAARKPDSSLDPLRPYTTPQQLEDLHLHFLGVWDKHHGF